MRFVGTICGPAALLLNVVFLAYLGCIHTQIVPDGVGPPSSPGEPSTDTISTISDRVDSTIAITELSNNYVPDLYEERARPHTHHLAALFQVDNFTAHAFALSDSLKRVHEAGLLPPHVTLRGMALPSEPPFHDPHSALIYICDAFYHNNVTSFLAIGDQNMINVLSIATQYVGVPLIVYNTDRSDIFVRVSGPQNSP